MPYQLIVILTLLLFSCAPAHIETQSVATQRIVSPPIPSPTPPDFPTPTLIPSSDRIVTMWVVTRDGSLWYSFDESYTVSYGLPNLGLYRMKDGHVSHYEMPNKIAALEAAPDGSLYVGTGCGVLRYQLEKWETLANPDCAHNVFDEIQLPIDIAITQDGDVWIAGIFGVAQYHDDVWIEYDLNATKLFVSPDGNLWADGWDGEADHHCCIAQFANGEWITYTPDPDNRFQQR